MPSVNSPGIGPWAILSRPRFSNTPIDHARTLCEIEKPREGGTRGRGGLPVNRGGKKIDKLIVIEAFVQYFFNKNPRDFFLIIQRSLGINLRHSSQRRQIYRFEEISVKFVRYFI